MEGQAAAIFVFFMLDHVIFHPEPHLFKLLLSFLTCHHHESSIIKIRSGYQKSIRNDAVNSNEPCEN